MDAIENGTTSLYKASKHWNIPLTSSFDHLYGKTKSRKCGPANVLIVKEDQVVVAWVFPMQRLGYQLTYNSLK